MSLQRKVFVTMGLVGIGAAVGSIAGVAFAIIAFTTSHHQSAQLASESFKLGTQTGAGLGMILGPLTAFTILRRVPLGKFIRNGVLGASLGAIAGIVAQRLDALPGHNGALLLAMSVGGFGLAAAHLWWRFRERTARLVGEAS